MRSSLKAVKKKRYIFVEFEGADPCAKSSYRRKSAKGKGIPRGVQMQFCCEPTGWKKGICRTGMDLTAILVPAKLGKKRALEIARKFFG